jgi:hypothetical protein
MQNFVAFDRLAPLTAFDGSWRPLLSPAGCVLSVFFSTTEAISAARAADGTISATNVKTTYDSRFTVKKRKANYFCWGPQYSEMDLGPPAPKMGPRLTCLQMTYSRVTSYV